MNFLSDVLFIRKQYYDSEAKTESEGHTWRELSENGTKARSMIRNEHIPLPGI